MLHASLRVSDIHLFMCTIMHEAYLAKKGGDLSNLKEVALNVDTMPEHHAYFAAFVAFLFQFSLFQWENSSAQERWK